MLYYQLQVKDYRYKYLTFEAISNVLFVPYVFVSRIRFFLLEVVQRVDNVIDVVILGELDKQTLTNGYDTNPFGYEFCEQLQMLLEFTCRKTRIQKIHDLLDVQLYQEQFLGQKF